MEINEAELKFMLNEIWAINNPQCLKATMIFLGRAGIKPNDIQKYVTLDHWEEEHQKLDDFDVDEYLEEVKWYEEEL